MRNNVVIYTEKAMVKAPYKDFVQMESDAIRGNELRESLKEAIKVTIGQDYKDQPMVMVETSFNQVLQDMILKEVLRGIKENPEALKLLVEKDMRYFDAVSLRFDDMRWVDGQIDILDDPELKAMWLKIAPEDEEEE